MLRCRDGSLYTGITNDLDRRLKAHAAATALAHPLAPPRALVYRERARDRSAALRREAALKRLTRAEKLALIAAPAERAPRKKPPRRRGGAPSAFSRASVKA
jgi:putative endonuclease